MRSQAGAWEREYQPERLAAMLVELSDYLASVSAQMPADKRTGKPVPLPML